MTKLCIISQVSLHDDDATPRTSGYAALRWVGRWMARSRHDESCYSPYTAQIIHIHGRLLAVWSIHGPITRCDSFSPRANYIIGRSSHSSLCQLDTTIERAVPHVHSMGFPQFAPPDGAPAVGPSQPSPHITSCPHAMTRTLFPATDPMPPSPGVGMAEPVNGITC